MMKRYPLHSSLPYFQVAHLIHLTRCNCKYHFKYKFSAINYFISHYYCCYCRVKCGISLCMLCAHVNRYTTAVYKCRLEMPDAEWMWPKKRTDRLSAHIISLAVTATHTAVRTPECSTHTRHITYNSLPAMPFFEFLIMSFFVLCFIHSSASRYMIFIQ